jgi:diacylglycerol kinase family enzyme
MALGILPLGTLNRLARDLRIPLTLPDAAAALAGARIQRIDVAEVNGRMFLCNSLMGLPTQFSSGRQDLRGKPALERLKGYLALLRDMLRSRRRLAINVDNGAERMRLRVMSLAVSNNAYSEKPSLMLERERLDGGRLAVYISRHRTGWHVVSGIVRALLGRFRSDPDVIHFDAQAVVVESKRRMIKLSNDGEVETMETPLRYTIRPQALSVLVPRAA